ncbi:alcohol dehydrogenase [Paenibacillaceae bacterium]|nr:alcohol dehydrogenase [Paenibacillaceae bacterium]
MDHDRVSYSRFGAPLDVLSVDRVRRTAPGPGQVLVRMLARPINPSDLIPVTGAYAHRISLPSIAGYEGVGIVDEIGPGVGQGLLGRRILPLCGEGTWQHYVKAPADWCVQVPEEVDDGDAAQLYINPLTAWLVCTEQLKLTAADTLLVNACGSAIGRLFAQLSRMLGFRLIAVVRNDRYTEELLRLGAAQVINTARTRLPVAVLELTGGNGATAAIDCVGGTAGTELAWCVRPGGVCVTLGLLSGHSVNWTEIAREAGVTVQLFHLRHWSNQVTVRRWQETFGQLISMVSDRRLQLMKPSARYKLRQVHEAVKAAQAEGGNKGKVLLV